jgi:2-polyprenyl-3-methyl-5-hydroxy-6-metoxy-1,4-benzoquinol methylase
VQSLIVSLENIPCCVGCEENDRILFSAHDLLNDLPGDFNVVKCQTCGLMRTNPRPTQDSIGFYYPDNYGPYLGSVVNLDNQKKHNSFKQFLKPFVNQIFNFKGTVLPPLKPGNMLEIGCASGSFLHHMAIKGWKVQGIEFSDKAAQMARKLGYKVHTGSLENAPQPDEPFDLIVGWMVLEHLHNPIDSLKKLKEWASPEAWLALSIPNAGSFEFKIFKDKGYALQLPTHLFHFTPQTLEKILLAGGWELEKIYHQRTLSNFIGSIGFVLRDKGYLKAGNWFIKFPERGGLMAYFLFPLAWMFSLIGQTGRMTVLARRCDRLDGFHKIT